MNARQFGALLLFFWCFLYFWRGEDYLAYQVFHRVAYEPVVRREAVRNELTPELVAAVIYTESRFDPKATSDRGAVGLMQMMPETAHWVAEQQGRTIKDLTDPRENIMLGTWYLSYLIQTFHSEVLALAAYNAGRGHVAEWIERYGWEQREPQIEEIPFPETREFVKSVLYYREVYRASLQGEEGT